MRRNTIAFIIQISIALIGSVALVVAQASCDVDLNDVITQVEDVCTSLGDNEVCYGNFEVNAVVQDNAPRQDFSEQGDLASVAYLRSLYLSGLDPDSDRWGIAQMRLVTNTSTGNQDINLLLFGDVQVDNNVEQTQTLDVVVGQYAANIRNSPRDNSLVLASVPSGEIINAVGRLEDSSWLRVTLTDGVVGWVSATLIESVNNSNLDSLEVQDSNTPYFGPMQAFYFTEGGDSQCGNVTADGLLIQTPEGSARVTILINEVSIELIPSQNGSTAVVTGNAVDGMTVSVIDGEAVVASGGSSFYVGATQETTIPLDANLSPTGAPSTPNNFDVEIMSTLPVLPIIRDTEMPIVPNNPNNGTNNANHGQQTGNANGSPGSAASGNAQGGAANGNAQNGNGGAASGNAQNGNGGAASGNAQSGNGGAASGNAQGGATSGNGQGNSGRANGN